MTTTGEVVVVGGGPAGLAAAIAAARAGARVRLLERNDQCGKKLLVTGGGHCNAANTLPTDQWPARFGKRGRFILPALKHLPLDAVQEWFRTLGQPLACRDGRHYFPESRSARAVRDALVAEAAAVGVVLETARRVTGVAAADGVVTGVATAEGVTPCGRVIVTGGGRSYPGTGSTGDGAAWAAALGHRVMPFVPGLVGLRSPDLSADLAGIVLPDAVVSYRRKGRPPETGRGELLLTHGGVSGPAVLDVSASVAEGVAAGEGPSVAVRWCADADAAAWRERLDRWRRERGGTAVAAVLKDYLPGRLARWLCARAGAAEGVTAGALPGGVRDALAAALGGYAVGIDATEGWDRAMISRGGVDVRDVDPATMRSRVIGGLAFAGEVLDVDGPCGGFNLHWALASGALAGAHGAKR